ncbi:MAG: T9SS type A sorting domain-containing protein [Crocinitomix sp.]|nr:T9SS type A sorting domain-containing protein [Crocinitomix sp.]
MKKKLLLGLAVGLGTFSYAQCDITGLSPIMCLSDTPVEMEIVSPGGAFVGPGVSGAIFSPADAGIGVHTITVSAPGEGYTVAEGVYDPIDISSGSTTIGGLGDDNYVGAFPIGFDFVFFGATYTQFYVGSNGFMGFSPGMPSGCCSGQNIPNGSTPNNLIAFAWEDLDPGNGGAPVENLVRYKLTGTAPNRVLTMEFYNVDHWSNGDNVTLHTQIYETTNCIEIHNTIQPQAGTHTQGIENLTGTEAYTSTGRNASSWTGSSDMWRFCPNVGCTGEIEVEVIASPVVDATIDEIEICLGESVTIDVTGDADSYYLGVGIEAGVPFIPAITGENVYIVSGTDEDAGCIATSLVSVFVHDIPFVSAGEDFSICEDVEFTLNGIGEDLTFVWDGGAVDGEPMMQDAGSVTYTVTGTNSGGCEASSSVTVESWEVPTGTGVVTMMTGIAYDGEIDFTPTGGTGGPYTFIWSNGATTEDVTSLGVGSYTVTVSDGTCDSDVSFFVDSQASIALNELDNVKVYPNPVVDFVTVEFEGTYNWTLFDNAGKIVSTGTANGKEQISMESLATGNYMMKVEVDGKQATVAVVKK